MYPATTDNVLLQSAIAKQLKYNNTVKLEPHDLDMPLS